MTRSSRAKCSEETGTRPRDGANLGSLENFMRRLPVQVGRLDNGDSDECGTEVRTGPAIGRPAEDIPPTTFLQRQEEPADGRLFWARRPWRKDLDLEPQEDRPDHLHIQGHSGREFLALCVPLLYDP